MLAPMPFWPFKRKKEAEDAYFASTGGATVAPSAPPVIGGAVTPEPSATTPASTAAPAVSGSPAVSSAVPPEVLQQLAAAGIHLDPNALANAQVTTQTAQLSGAQAVQFLGQLGSFLSAASMSNASVQFHPQINLVTAGRLQERPEQLKTGGVDAQVTIADLQEKMAMAGATHLVKLKLKVTREGQEPYETITAAVVPASVTEQFAEGKTFPAKVDPNDKNQVLVLWPDA
jgi:hypothetical protein